MDLAACAERLERMTERDPNSGCWLWSGNVDGPGYGVLRLNGKSIKAHRLSYLLEHGSLNGVEMVCHHCDVRRCVNPAHLYAGNAKTNARDMFDRHRARRDGEHNGRAKLTPEQVEEIRSVLCVPLAPHRRRRRRGTMAALAQKYGVYRTVLHRIATGEIWSEAA